MATFRLGEAGTARLLLILLSFCWGLSWPAMKVALAEIGPWALRVISYTIGAGTLLVLIRLQGRSFSIPRRKDWLHIIVASIFNVVAFGLFANFAQLVASTSRVVIITNSMPVWGSLLAWMILGERITSRTAIGLLFCVAGLAVLVYPAASTTLQEPVGLLLALGCALSWGCGTIYMKWARIKGDLLAISFWQIAFGIIAFAVGYLIFEGAPAVEQLSSATWLSLLYHGVLGTGFAYFIWFNIIGRLSTADASLGSLANPVVGVIGSAILLGERPTAADITGFALIFSAAACVLIPQRRRPVAQTP